MTLLEFAEMLDGRDYGREITKEEEALAKELGFVVVFGYSDDNAELRGAIDDEIGCFDGGVVTHEDLRGDILAQWCPEGIDCSWCFSTNMPSERFNIFENGELFCMGLVIDNNKPKPKTNADRMNAMSIEEKANFLTAVSADGCPPKMDWDCAKEKAGWEACDACWCKWLQQPAEEGATGDG